MTSSVDQILQSVEEAIHQLDFPRKPTNLYEPIRYTLGLGGKRMRPVLVVLAHEMFGGYSADAIPAALAVEVFHNFTLLHDDLMDKAPLRRGKPTVHHKWSPEIAILSGDAMFVKSCQLISQCPSAHKGAALQIFLSTAMEVCEGQQYDMDFEQMDTVTVPQYLDMIRLKTAVLLGASLSIGATLAGAGDRDVRNLYDFGVNLGTAFQLQDDILDVFGDEAKFGKQVGGDILSNKKTFLLLRAFELAHGETLENLRFWIRNNTWTENHSAQEKVTAVKSIYTNLGIREEAEQKMDELYSIAEDCLDQLQLSVEQTTVLRQLANQLMERQH